MCSLSGYDSVGQQVCCLTIGTVNRAGHTRLTVDLTHRELGRESDEGFDHQVRTGFAIDPGKLSEIRAEWIKKMKGVTEQTSLSSEEPQPLDLTCLV